MLQPVRRRTWAPRGRTPVQKTWDRRDRLSAIGTLTVSPLRRRINLYFSFLSRNVDAHDLVHFVRQLHRCLRTPLVLVWDRSGPHRAAAKQLERDYHWATIEWLPPYAPRLNPQEHCWDQTKYHDLANFLPHDTDQLYQAAAASFSQQRTNQQLLRSHFAYAKLPL